MEAKMNDMTEVYKPTRGRPPSDTPRDSWNVKIDLDVAIWWRTYLYDEIEQRVRKGSMSDLTSRLLRDEMQRILAGGAPR
jgi:hypothetical protein